MDTAGVMHAAPPALTPDQAREQLAIARSTRALAETTQHLREALASPKARGQWGERMADDGDTARAHYGRVLLKISGEALAGEQGFGIAPPVIDKLTNELRGAWRFRRYALAIAWGVCVVGWLAVLSIPDTYEARARVNVDTRTALSNVLAGQVR